MTESYQRKGRPVLNIQTVRPGEKTGVPPVEETVAPMIDPCGKKIGSGIKLKEEPLPPMNRIVSG